MKRQKPEILSPAGSYEAFIAAIANGCDAVYLGGKAFGARAYATNFDVEMLQKVVRQAHLYGKKVYYTLNTLVKDIEWKTFEKACKELDTCQVDAVIIQDIGVYYYIQQHYPHWNVHASTQMNLHHKDDLTMAKKMGFERVVVSRECSLASIEAMKENVSIEIEAFVHGALCYCYSGRCLMSSFYGGRSGNRGKCAQPCRLAYKVDNQEGYYLSPKDQMTLDQIPALILAGIDSFKIEGRMKKPEYVALTTRMYRKYTDLAYRLIEEDRVADYCIEEADIEALNQMYNRGSFTEGYYKQHNSPSMISMDHSKHLGLALGLGQVTYKGLTIETDRNLHVGDVLELHHTKDGDRRENLTLTVEEDKQRTFNIKQVPQLKRIENGAYPLYLIVDKQLNESQLIDETALPKLPVHMTFTAKIGEPMTLSIEYDGVSVAVTGDRVEAAKTRGVDEKTVCKQLQKLGDTPYELNRLESSIEENVFVPVSQLNQLRREGIYALNEQRLHLHEEINRQGALENGLDTCFMTEEGCKHESSVQTASDLRQFTLSITSMEQLEFLASQPLVAFSRLYIDFYTRDMRTFNTMLMKIKSHHKHIALYLAWPHVMTPSKEKRFLAFYEDCKEYMDGYLIRTIGQLWRLKDCKKALALDYHWNVFNQSAVSFVETFFSVTSMMFSLEQNEAGLRQMIKDAGVTPEIYVYGHNGLMVAANCIYQTRNGVCDYQDEGHVLTMEDRKGEKLIVRTHCHMCYNTIHNSKPLYLLDKLSELEQSKVQGLYRIEWTDEELGNMRQLLSQIDSHYQSGSLNIPVTDTQIQPEQMTRGHFNKGVK